MIRLGFVQALEEQQRFVGRLQRHSGNVDAPFLQDPFDDDKRPD